MAEKSGELEIRGDTDVILEIDKEETALQTRAGENSLTDGVANETEANEDEVNDETEELREKIEETRRGMSETIDAIQEKLSFSNISEQVKDQVSEQISDVVETAKDAFYGKAGEIANTVSKGLKGIGQADLVKSARKNPQILAIVGAGVGALLVGIFVSSGKKKSKKKKNVSYRYKNFSNKFSSKNDKFDDKKLAENEIRYADQPKSELKSANSAEPSESKFKSAENKTSDTKSSTFEGVSNTASAAYASVSGAAGSAYEGIGSAAGKTYETIGAVAGYSYDKAGDLGGQAMKSYDYYIEENPLAVGAVALALGAAVGFAIPLTKAENKYLGEYRDNVLDKAQTAAQDAIGTVKQMAGDAQKAIVEEVKTKTAS